MFSYIQYFPLTHKYGMRKIVEKIDINNPFFERAQLYNNCITFIIVGDWRRCDLDECTKALINIR